MLQNLSENEKYTFLYPNALFFALVIQKIKIYLFSFVKNLYVITYNNINKKKYPYPSNMTLNHFLQYRKTFFLIFPLQISRQVTTSFTKILFSMTS